MYPSSTSTSTNHDHVQFLEELQMSEAHAAKKRQIEEFTQKHGAEGTRIVLVTSGGTTVPLESRTVRFLDNFSIGTRGATSAEYFLRHDYAVVFLHRLRSLQPFSHRVDKDILNFLSVEDKGSEELVTVNQSCVTGLVPVLKEYHKYRSKGRILLVDFTTLTDYFVLLRAAAESIQVCGSRGMIYLAAAVSDFYIPRDEMPEHKMQSSEGARQLNLQMTPKLLKPLVKDWASQAFIVSFKLETDPALLVSKAKKALETYCHQVVVANLLDTRKKEVVIITREIEESLKLTEAELSAGQEIECPLISRLVAFHTQWIQQTGSVSHPVDSADW